MIDGDWRVAEETYRRLIELRPSFAEAHSGLAEVRGVGFGDLEAAVRESRLARPTPTAFEVALPCRRLRGGHRRIRADAGARSGVPHLCRASPLERL
jgi:hypothetical protein